MAMQRRVSVGMLDVFPHGAFVVGTVEPVLDFQAPQAAPSVRAQMKDPESGLPLWQVQVLDADPNAGKRDKTVTVKLAAAQQPNPPKPENGMPFTAVEFTGLTATPYVDDNGNRPRLAWSFRAEGMQAPKYGKQSTNPAAA